MQVKAQLKHSFCGASEWYRVINVDADGRYLGANGLLRIGLWMVEWYAFDALEQVKNIENA